MEVVSRHFRSSELRPPAVQSALPPQYRLALYRAWGRVGLSAIGPAGAVMTLILIGVGAGGCSMSRTDDAFAKMDDNDLTGSIGPPAAGGPAPTESDLAFARNAASDVLTKGDKDSSQPWENPDTGARGSVTPLAQAYDCGRDAPAGIFWQAMSMAATRAGCRAPPARPASGRWEIHTLKPWRQG